MNLGEDQRGALVVRQLLGRAFDGATELAALQREQPAGSNVGNAR